MTRKPPQTHAARSKGLNNQGRACAAQRRFDDAASCFAEAVKLAPTAENYCDLAQALILCRRFDEALAAARQAIALNPRLALAHCHVGTVLKQYGSLLDARDAFATAAELESSCSDALQRLAEVSSHLCDWEQAIGCYIRALELNPASSALHSSLLFTLTISGTVDAARLLEEHERWAAMHCTSRPAPFDAAPCDTADRKLRIGFVSGDFRDHPVRFFIAPVLRHLDRQQFTVVCYSTASRTDFATAPLRALADEWHDVTAFEDAALEHHIRRGAIDILVDLSGHTGGNRLKVFARRPAPVQVTYLGYPNTTGLVRIDYWITDAVLHPDGTPQKTSEQVWCLPRCWVAYEPPANAPEPYERPADAPVTFVSFNALQKLGPNCIRLWARVLAAVPDSILLLKAGGLGGPREQALIRERFGRAGIAADRLVLMGQVASPEEHLALYGQADIALDTMPFSGGTTTAEALWMGVPVVTLPADLMISRMSASMLHAAGLDELIATDPDDFVRIALKLARDSAYRRELRRRLRPQLASSPLCDGRGLATAIGSAFRQMWTLRCAPSETLEAVR